MAAFLNRKMTENVFPFHNTDETFIRKIQTNSSAKSGSKIAVKSSVSGVAVHQVEELKSTIHTQEQEIESLKSQLSLKQLEMDKYIKATTISMKFA